MPANTEPSRFTTVVVTAIAPMAWGTTYIVATELLPPGRPLLAGVLRAAPAGLVLAAVTRRAPQGWWWAKAAVLGVLNIGAFFALLFLAAYRLPGGIAASVGAIQPLVAATMAAALLGERLRPTTLIAGVLGVGGVVMLVTRSTQHLDVAGVGAAVAGTISMASGVVLTKHWGCPVSLLAFTSWQLLAGGAFLAPLALAVEGLPPTISGHNLLGYLWLTTLGTGVAYSLWFRGIGLLPVASTSILALLSPTVAAIAGWVVLGQTLNLLQVVGVASILFAVLFAQLTVHRPTVPPETVAADPATSFDLVPTTN